MESRVETITRRYPITLVTAYFNLGDRSGLGRDHHFYDDRMRYFFPHIQWPLVIFCDKESLDGIKQLRGGKPATYIVTTLEEFHVYKYYGRFYYEGICGQWAFGYQDLLMVWNEKLNFVRRAIKLNPYESDMFFWCDAGCFRGAGVGGAGIMRLSDRTEWPNFQVCRKLPQDKAIFMRASQVGEKIYVRATFFGGAAKPMLRWCDAFYQHLADRVDKNLLLFADERSMSDVCDERPDVVHLLSPDDVAWVTKVVGNDWQGDWQGFFKWYFLNGGKFPLGFLCIRISYYLRNRQLMKWLLSELLYQSRRWLRSSPDRSPQNLRMRPPRWK